MTCELFQRRREALGVERLAAVGDVRLVIEKPVVCLPLGATAPLV